MSNVGPLARLGALVAIIFIGTAFVFGIIVTGDHGNSAATTPYVVTILGMIGTAVPALLALNKAETASRDIRNGVLVSKVKEGTTQALQESDTLNAPAQNATLAALTVLLDKHMAAVETNTNATQTNTNAQQTTTTATQ